MQLKELKEFTVAKAIGLLYVLAVLQELNVMSTHPGPTIRVR